MITGKIMKLRKLFVALSALALSFGASVAAMKTLDKTDNHVETTEVSAADYSSTIRVYFQIDTSKWGTINYVRLGGKEASDNAALVTSNAKYNRDLGNYVRDISSGSTYDKMGVFFSENGTWFEYQYDGGYKWLDGGFKPGHEYQMKNVRWVADQSGYKQFYCDAYDIGEIRDNAQNSTFYFVDGHSWHASRSVTAHLWGGTISSTYPGFTMSDSGLRIKAWVGETEYSGLYIMQYTLSGSAAYVKFSNNNGGQETGDLALTDGGIYFFGVDGLYKPVVELLVTTKGQLGSYTYGGRNFSKSICHLTQSQASTFVSTFDNIVSTGGDGLASSVQGSGIVTYNSPETGTGTGEVSLTAIRAELIKKYPSIVSGAKSISLFGNGVMSQNTVVIVIVSSLIAVAGVGGFFLLRKRKEQ